MALLTVSQDALVASRGVARAYVQRHNILDDRSRKVVESFIMYYDAVRQVTGNHHLGLYVASNELKSMLPGAPTRSFSYPSSAGDLFDGIKFTPDVVGSYIKSVFASSTKKKDDGTLIDGLLIENKPYYFRSLPHITPLFGLEHEMSVLEKYTRQLFLYDPATAMNIDNGFFPRTILLTGPPGTGKSSLLKHIVTCASSLSSVAQVPFRFSNYDASHFSSYFGKSTRILKGKLRKLQNPAAIGIFCIEDVDMVFQSRQDAQTFHGVLQAQQYLMNHLSGFEPYFGNYITFLTTNSPDALDPALRDRVQEQFVINPFSQIETHKSFLQHFFPSASRSDIAQCAQLTHDASFRGRDLESIVSIAKSKSVSMPSDEEIMQKKRLNAPASISIAFLKELIAEKKALRHTIM